jgi:AcrR family transcriptional regulator
MDARSLRTREALREAVLGLAEQQPIGDVSVAALCRRADVTRDTFYRYADSPVALLAEVLADEIAELSASFTPGTPIGDAERRLLEHVISRAEIYRGAMQPLLAPAIRAELERVVRDGLVQWAQQHPGIAPDEIADDADSVRLAATYAAAGTVGAIELWLREGAHDVDWAVRAILAASPSWWLREIPSPPHMKGEMR